MADAVVFDTSAFLTLTGEEPGADMVQKLTTDALAGIIELHASFVSLTEVEYITRQEEGEAVAVTSSNAVVGSAVLRPN